MTSEVRNSYVNDESFEHIERVWQEFEGFINFKNLLEVF